MKNIDITVLRVICLVTFYLFGWIVGTHTGFKAGVNKVGYQEQKKRLEQNEFYLKTIQEIFQATKPSWDDEKNGCSSVKNRLAEGDIIFDRKGGRVEYNYGENKIIVCL